MAQQYRSKCCLIYDFGQFIELAVTLSKSFGRTLYFAPWTGGGVPNSNILRTGQGIDGIERVDEIWPYLDDVDLFVFSDVHEGGLQEYLASIGKRVWGCRGGGYLELDRVASKETSKKLGIDIGPYKPIIGIDPLRRHLKANEDQWVKISVTRGDMETFHSQSYEQSEQILDELAHNLGPKKNVMEFVVEQSIPDAIEVGYDGYTVDGQFAKAAMIGIEEKGEAYVARTMRYAKLPDKVRVVNEKLGPALKKAKYRGFISTELRCVEEKAYLIDPCCRCGTPPTEVIQVIIENLADVLWQGSEGIIVEPEYRARYGAMVVLRSQWVTENWQHISFPSEIRERVKLHNFTVIDGEYYVIPHINKTSQIGAVVGVGDTADEAIADCETLAEQVEGHCIEKAIEALPKAREKLDELLGADKPESPQRRRATELMRRGEISGKQFDRMVEQG